jgi:hypothetical protein
MQWTPINYEWSVTFSVSDHLDGCVYVDATKDTKGLAISNVLEKAILCFQHGSIVVQTATWK